MFSGKIPPFLPAKKLTAPAQGPSPEPAFVSVSVGNLGSRQGTPVLSAPTSGLRKRQEAEKSATASLILFCQTHAASPEIQEQAIDLIQKKRPLDCVIWVQVVEALARKYPPTTEAHQAMLRNFTIMLLQSSDALADVFYLLGHEQTMMFERNIDLLMHYLVHPDFIRLQRLDSDFFKHMIHALSEEYAVPDKICVQFDAACSLIAGQMAFKLGLYRKVAHVSKIYCCSLQPIGIDQCSFLLKPSHALNLMQYMFDKNLSEESMVKIFTFLEKNQSLLNNYSLNQFLLAYVQDGSIDALEEGFSIFKQHQNFLNLSGACATCVAFLKSHPRESFATFLEILLQRKIIFSDENFMIGIFVSKYFEEHPNQSIEHIIEVVLKYPSVVNDDVLSDVVLCCCRRNSDEPLELLLNLMLQHKGMLTNEGMSSDFLRYIQARQNKKIEEIFSDLNKYEKCSHHVRSIALEYMSTNPSISFDEAIEIALTYSKILEHPSIRYFLPKYFEEHPGESLQLILDTVMQYQDVLKHDAIVTFVLEYLKTRERDSLGDVLSVLAKPDIQRIFSHEKNKRFLFFIPRYLKKHPEYSVEEMIHYQLFFEQASSPKEFLERMKDFEELPPKKQQCIKDLYDLHSICFRDGGTNQNGFEVMWREQVSRMKPTRLSAESFVPYAASDAGPIDLSSCQFVKAVGRTLLFRQPGTERLLAIKIPKKGESLERLQDEARMCSYLGAHQREFDLKSEIPVNPRMVSLKLQHEHWRELAIQGSKPAHEFTTAVIADAPTQALAFEVGPHYYEYLDEAYSQKSSDKALHDIAVLMRHGLFPAEMTPLFHNMEHPSHPRPYVWNPEELQAASNSPGEGPGRMHAALEMALFANFRVSGLADFKATYCLDELLTKHSKREYFDANSEEERDTIAALSVMGDALLSWSLVLVNAWHRQGGDFNLAHELEHGFVTFYSAYTGLSRVQALQHLRVFTDFDRMALQFAFFTTEAYLVELKEHGTISDATLKTIYGEDVDAGWEMTAKSRGFNVRFGWEYNQRDKDLGPVNGALPIQEWIKGIYAATHLAMLHQASVSS